MVRIVICKTTFLGDSRDALTRARAATPRGKKNLWDHKYCYDTLWPVNYRIYKTTGHYRTVLVWKGSEVDFLLFKLSETTGLVQTFMDVEKDDPLWTMLTWQATKRDVYVEDFDHKTIDRVEFRRLFDLCVAKMGTILMAHLKPVHHLL